MRRGGLFMVLGLLLLVAAVAGFLLLSRQSAAPSQQQQPVVPQKSVVVALQDIPRGTVIEKDMVGMQSYPADSLQSLEAELILDADQVVGKMARSDIGRRQPVLAGMLMDSKGGVSGGSDAALLIPAGQVAMALRIDQLTSVAYAIQPGDHVDVLMSMRLVDLDPDFQARLPNDVIILTQDGTKLSWTGQEPVGKMTPQPNGLWNEIPSEAQRARAVAQLTLQNLLVLGVGNWPNPQAEPVATPTPTSKGRGAEASPAPGVPNVITLALSQQDALVLQYAQEAQATITLVLRRTGDEAQVTTDSVTLSYLLDRFKITTPPKLPIGIEPAPTPRP